MNRAGELVSNLSGDAAYRSFRPAPLPPVPSVEVDVRMARELGLASRKLAELDTLALHVPDVSLFMAMYVRKEALISSQIEGTQCTIDDMLDPDAESNAGLDVADVLSYVAAVRFAVERRRELPLCCRLLREIHAVLLDNARGAEKEPGEFRRSQNWIGPAGCSLRNARYIPPNVEDMADAMSDLEKFIHAEDGTDPLIKAALVHYQFETIHPFLDGNGRIGRMLILLCLEEWGLLHSPVLYVSYFLKKNQWEYYGRLAQVRETGNYESWVLFFLEAVHAAAENAVESVHALRSLFRRDAESVHASCRPGSHAAQLFSMLASAPIVTARIVSERLGISRSSAQQSITALVRAGILAETTNRRRSRVYAYSAYLDILRKDAEPI